jgi:hypothetical protein
MYLIAPLFIVWFSAYVFCDWYGVKNVDLFRGALNTFMATFILAATLIERYILMWKAKDYDVLIESNALLPGWSMAFVPFAGAISDLSRASLKGEVFTFFFSLMLLISLIDFLFYLMLTNKSIKDKLLSFNILAVIISLALLVCTSEYVGSRIIAFLY